MTPLTERGHTEAPRFDFFFYGTLCDCDVRAAVVGREVPAVPAVLPDHEAVPVDRDRFPILLFQRGHEARGVLCRGLTLIETARLGFYENEGRDYGAHLMIVRLLGESAAASAWVFVPTPALRRGPGRWDFETWRRFAKRDYLARVSRTMREIDPRALDDFVGLWRKRAATGR